MLDACSTLDRKDSNLQSPGPKPVALPLGHGPVLNKQEKEREGGGGCCQAGESVNTRSRSNPVVSIQQTDEECLFIHENQSIEPCIHLSWILNGEERRWEGEEGGGIGEEVGWFVWFGQEIDGKAK